MNSCPDTKFPSAARMNSCPDTKLPSAARMNSCPDTKFPSAARMNSCPDTKLPSDVPDLRRSAEPRPAPPTRRNPFEQDDWDTARALPARARATAYISRLVCALARYIYCLTIHSYPETIVFVENYAPTSSGRFFLATRPALPLPVVMFFSNRGAELTEKNQPPELPGLCIFRASVANSVFVSFLDGVCLPSRLRASGRRPL